MALSDTAGTDGAAAAAAVILGLDDKAIEGPALLEADQGDTISGKVCCISLLLTCYNTARYHAAVGHIVSSRYHGSNTPSQQTNNEHNIFMSADALLLGNLNNL